MTKAVRIENADTSHYTVVVEVWQRTKDDQDDIRLREVALVGPTQMLTEYIHSGQYLVIREA